MRGPPGPGLAQDFQAQFQLQKDISFLQYLYSLATLQKLCKFCRRGEQQRKNATKEVPTDWAVIAVGGCRRSGVGREESRVNPSSIQAFPLQGDGPQARASFGLVGFSLLVVPLLELGALSKEAPSAADGGGHTELVSGGCLLSWGCCCRSTRCRDKGWTGHLATRWFIREKMRLLPPSVASL